MGKRFSPSRGESAFEEAIINLTPLIDVVFVVLIIFIIVAPMLELDRVELATAAASPDKQIAASPENGVIAIHVHQDNSIWLNGKRVDEQQLVILLKEARRLGKTRIPQLFHDKKACFGTYQTVKNAVELAGFEQLDVILKPG
jgi:biopolymer transport protein ExbD